MTRRSLLLIPLVLALALVALLALRHPLQLRWGDFGTLDWIAYWSFPRGALLGYGFFDSAWQEAAQRAVGYGGILVGRSYPVVRLWNPPPATLFFLPLSALSFSAATWLWLGLSAFS